jgi:hypothetical protein
MVALLYLVVGVAVLMAPQVQLGAALQFMLVAEAVLVEIRQHLQAVLLLFCFTHKVQI